MLFRKNKKWQNYDKSQVKIIQWCCFSFVYLASGIMGIVQYQPIPVDGFASSACSRRVTRLSQKVALHMVEQAEVVVFGFAQLQKVQACCKRIIWIRKYCHMFRFY